MKYAACAAVLFFILSSSAGSSENVKTGRYIEPECFEVAIPDGWAEEGQDFGLSPAEKKIYGIGLTYSTGYGGGTLRMSAYYYAPDNLMDTTPEKYIRVHSTKTPQDGRAFPRLPKTDDGKVGGRAAKVFGNITYQSSNPGHLDAERLEVWESFAVIPLEHGYYALRYSALADKYEQGLPAFEAFLASFKPLKK